MSILHNNNVKLLVSDMAGTIINEKGLIYIAMKNTLTRMGFCVSDADMKSWHGKDKIHVLSTHINAKYNIVSEKYNEPVIKEASIRLIDELDKLYFQDKNIELIDSNLLPFFDNLRRDGIKVALNTGYPQDFQHKIIHHFNLQNHIDTWISSSQVVAGRPHPYMIQKLIEDCEIPSTKNVAKIGDTINDILEGKNAGCVLNIGVMTGADSRDELLEHTDFVINKITDLGTVWQI
mgnify:FL=1